MKRSIGFVVFGLLLGVANPAHAQTGAFGIGPRVTFQSGSESVPDSCVQNLRRATEVRLNPSTAIEVSADYESDTQRITDTAREDDADPGFVTGFYVPRRVRSVPARGHRLVSTQRSRRKSGPGSTGAVTTTDPGDGLSRRPWRRAAHSDGAWRSTATIATTTFGSAVHAGSRYADDASRRRSF